MGLLLFLIPSSLQSVRSENSIGIIYINGDGTYTLVSKPIDVSCDEWWQKHLKITENKNHKGMENLYVHTIFGKKVIGHICNY